jgi:hypothetical protein
MPRYRVGVVAYGMQAYYQEVVVEAENGEEAAAKAADVANERDDYWEASGDQAFDKECWAEKVTNVSPDTPLTEGADG